MLDKIAIWEECARDGAQAKTIMSARQRIEIAKNTCAIFFKTSRKHIIFASGFPSSSAEEFEIIREMAEAVRDCHLATHARASRRDIDRSIEALAGAELPRVTFFVPMSPATSKALGFASPQAAMENGLDLAKYAKDRAAGVPLDVALVDSPQVDPEPVADYALRLADAGVEVAKLCDSRGVFFPNSADDYYRRFFASLGADRSKLLVGIHNHNDLGFATTNNFKGLEHGASVVSSSWLGLGERSGLARTEELITAGYLSQILHHPQVDLLDTGWPRELRTHMIRPTAARVSEYTGVPLKITDAVVGGGINSISTGTPFSNPSAFQPFDPIAILDCPREIYLTQLSSVAIIQHVSDRLGYELSDAQAKEALKWVKAQCYRSNSAVLSRTEFSDYLSAAPSQGAPAIPSRTAEVS